MQEKQQTCTGRITYQHEKNQTPLQKERQH
jgi:hypothetical protein